MRRFIAQLLAAVVLAASIPATALATGGAGPSMLPPKTPLRYVQQTYAFSTTAAITAAVVGVCPVGGATLKDVVLLQVAAGTGGTSWTATPKKNGTALVGTPGGFTLAAGANKATNAVTVGSLSLANPSGGTRPVLTAAQVKCTGGDAITIDIALSGSYTVAVTGSVLLLWEPAF